MYESIFSKWLPWDDRKNIPNKKLPGIYVAALSSDSLSGEEFSWREEIIYIGMTNSIGGLIGRLSHFDDTISGKKLRHGGADRVRFRHTDYEVLKSNLFVSVTSFECDVESKSPSDLRKMGKVLEFEFLCFAEFVEKFGRLPEFNDMKASPKFSLEVKAGRR